MEHQKTKIVLEQKINEVESELKKYEEKDRELSQILIKSEEENKRLLNKISYLDNCVQ